MLALLGKAWRRLRNNTRDFGIVKALHDAAYRSLNYLVGYMNVIAMEVSCAAALPALAAQYRGRFLNKDALLPFTKDPEYQMTEPFLDDAFATGNECYAISDGDILASYCWYGKVSSPISDELAVDYSPAYVYVWKAYTHPDYRGRRLHALGMAQALHAYRERGYAGLLCMVEANNYRSFNSVYRLGFKNTGRIYVVRLFGRHFVYHTAACRRYGFRVHSNRRRNESANAVTLARHVDH